MPWPVFVSPPPATLPKSSWVDTVFGGGSSGDPNAFSRAFAAAGGAGKTSLPSDLSYTPNYFGAAESAISRISSVPSYRAPSVTIPEPSIDWGASYARSAAASGGFVGKIALAAAALAVGVFAWKRLRRGGGRSRQSFSEPR